MKPNLIIKSITDYIQAALNAGYLITRNIGNTLQMINPKTGDRMTISASGQAITRLGETTATTTLCNPQPFQKKLLLKLFADAAKAHGNLVIEVIAAINRCLASGCKPKPSMTETVAGNAENYSAFQEIWMFVRKGYKLKICLQSNGAASTVLTIGECPMPEIYAFTEYEQHDIRAYIHLVLAVVKDRFIHDDLYNKRLADVSKGDRICTGYPNGYAEGYTKEFLHSLIDDGNGK